MSHTPDNDEMRPEDDFSDGTRGKHYKAYQDGTNLVVLEADVDRVFRNSESVNRALRLLLELASDEVKKNLTSG